MADVAHASRAGRSRRALWLLALGAAVGVVAMAWPLLAGLARWGDGAYHRFAVEAGTGLVCALGVFWLVSRAYG